jgi:ADP-heptose:LPS heptosyltransferase
MQKKYIIISPWSKMLRDGSYNPKNYHAWPEVIDGLKDDFDIIQTGVSGEVKLVDDFRIGLPLKEIKRLLIDPNCHTWIAVDNFLGHLAHLVGKPGIAIWGLSDPNVFGYRENKNLLKARKYLRDNQFFIWDGLKYDSKVFVDADKVIAAVHEYSI